MLRSLREPGAVECERAAPDHRHDDHLAPVAARRIIEALEAVRADGRKAGRRSAVALNVPLRHSEPNSPFGSGSTSAGAAHEGTQLEHIFGKWAEEPEVR